MNSLPKNPSLREINAYKKKINWGEFSSLYHMATTSASDLDELLSHGFDSGFKSILNKNNWNLKALDGSKDKLGNITVNLKPKIILRHVYNEMGYELHCYPLVNDRIINYNLIDSPDCPFIKWHSEAMKQLFRVSSLPTFIMNTVTNGDEADFALIKHIYIRVEKLIELLSKHFDIDTVKGYTIAEFFKQVSKRNGVIAPEDLTPQDEQ